MKFLKQSGSKTKDPNISARTNALMLGLPALIVAILAVSAVGGVQYLSKDSLEDNYKYLFDKATSDLTQLNKDLIRKQKIQRIDGGPANVVSDEDRQQMKEFQDAQKIYLDKLITISPDVDSYRFDLARLVASRGDRAHARSILNDLAPEDAPGYPEAHFVLAQFYFDEPARTSIQVAGNLTSALKHIDHVLTRDDENLRAKLLKARVLTRMQRYDAAYQEYEDLFEENPNHYIEMTKLNKELKRTGRDNELYERALAKFQQLSGKTEFQEDNRRWVVVESGISRTLQSLERFEEAEERLNSLVETYRADPKGGPRRVFLQRLLAEVYLRWGDSLADNKEPYNRLPENELEKLLDIYTKAHRNYPAEPTALQALARLSLVAAPSIAERAKSVYDPYDDDDAPAQVLNQLGSHALMNKQFQDAIRHYERARSKAPRDWTILNNLSYCYLVSDDTPENAERSLKLINEAIEYLPKTLPESEVSKFLHTKATALKQQDRLQEALAVYERSLKARPMHADTLRSLVECYRGLQKIPPEQYVARLEQITEGTLRDDDVVTP